MLSRRDFLTTTTAASLGAWASRAQVHAALDATVLRINSGRLREQLEHLSTFGRPEGGAFADGVTRLGYSEADAQGRKYVMDLMRGAGLSPTIDPAGNIFARRPGLDAGLKPILFGSHIDSVPSGGNFDGDLGSLAAIEVVRVLTESNVRTGHTLEVVVWANEEGGAYQPSLSGSRAVVGESTAAELDITVAGVPKREAVSRIGGDAPRLREARKVPGSYAGYVELHIEQGGTLERAGLTIGVVEGIVAVDRYEVGIQGFANHAGTTPMADRQDALLAASALVLAVNETVKKEAGRQVGTVGQLEVSPNAANVIPGRVRLTIELRDLQEATLVRLADAIKARAHEIASSTRTDISFTPLAHHVGATADPHVQTTIERAADRLGLSHTRLPSGAGHDAQMAARLCPMGMIFVPSVGGISHSPKELTTWEDCAHGANALLHTVLLLDESPTPHA